MKLYIAGPMRGYPEFNFPAFFAAEQKLRAAGYEVVNPAQHDLDIGFNPAAQTGNEDLDELGFDLAAAMEWDLEQVRQSDGVAALPGWSKSEGANREIDEAEKHSKPWQGVEHWVHLAEAKPLVTATEEVRSVSSTGGEKGVKPARFDLIPVPALEALARHYGAGAKKYADNQWRKGYEWSKSYAALQRHLTAWWGGEDIDEETGSNHLAAVAWHAFTLLTFVQEYPEFDDRYTREKAQ